MRRRDSCFCLIDSARLEFDKKMGLGCREAQPIQNLKFRLQQVLVTTIWLTF